MRKQIKSLLLAVVLIGMTSPVWGQASTQGKDFWLATTIVCQPPTASAKAVPYIAISTKEACVVSITDYQGVSVVTQHGTSNVLNQIPLGAGSWTEFGNTNATVQLYDIDPAKWYPTTNVVSAGDVYKHADEKNRYGLHVTSDKDISVFVVLRATNSMDASNILPVTAIQSEYYTQDYWPYAKDVSTNVTMATILAVEDNTVVDITPKEDTYGKSNAGQTFNVTLNKGETYYLMSKSGQQLAGTHIKAQNEKKIAVYNGCPLTTVPVLVTARDGMYEQSMPVDYWGTDFIVTRSKHKDGNIVGITASNDGTNVYIDGHYRTTIEHAGDTYCCMLQSVYNPNSKKPGDKPLNTSDVFTADVAYIYTSCPCAVYSYDTGNAFVYDNNNNENVGSGDDRLGDPSSVWISPIQQTIKEITFGTCYTNKTTMHYLNVVTETATAQQTTLAYRNGTSMVDCSNLLEWTVVDGNTKYSYARALISDNEPSKNVFTLKNPAGFIAHVYGNGDDESYAYSAGSAAVEQGVIMDGETFTNGYRSDTKFCIDKEFTFNAKIGTDEITRVDWDFGDGTTEYNGNPVTTHTYTVPGWYDVTADLYGNHVCTDESNVPLGSVSFTFRVVRADTIIVAPSPDDRVCFDTTETKQFIETYGLDSLNYLLANGKRQIINPDAPCYEDRKLSLVPYGIATAHEFKAEGRDSVFVNGQWYLPETLPLNGLIKWQEKNQYGCDSFITCHAKIITCLGIEIPNRPEVQHLCLFEQKVIPVTYEKFKGEIKDEKAVFTIDELPSFKVEIPVSNDNTKGTLNLPMDDGTVKVDKPGYYTGRIKLEDNICTDQPREFMINITVFYPSNIFTLKFNNVLAVYKPGAGGNKVLKADFTAYQWYRNGAPITGATESILYLGEGISFNKGDEVFVELTDKNGLTLPSCPQTLTNIPDLSPQPNNAPARKVIMNNNIVILRDEKSFNIYGQRVQ